MIERLGGALKYSDVADKIFRSNLSMIDLHMGRLMAEMTRLMWLDGITKGVGTDGGNQKAESAEDKGRTDYEARLL